jgi:alkanesulfonate monooxygenase SsuD/methylene tetrahydromethanopterin reductase-like flavin-dependent oxidoreductase (luciferase family)
MCEEAERQNGHSVWVTEHHRFDDGYLPQPLTMCAAIAARTNRLRIGTAVMVAPFVSSVALAEQAAIVDVISGGRLELGLGTGYRKQEFAFYGADFKTRYDTLDSRVRDLRELWRPGGVTPLPIQARPPIWLGYQGPKGARRAGLLGEKLLTLSPEAYEAYRLGLIEGGHDPASAATAGVLHGWVTEDPEGDWPLVAKHLTYQLESYRRHALEGEESPPLAPIDAERIRAKGRTPLGPFFYGTPADVARQVKDHCADRPVETVFFWGSIGGMPDDLVARHVNILTTRLAPLLAS